MMKTQIHLLRFLATIIIWIIAIFIMAITIFFILRVIAFYGIGGDFLFSSGDIYKAYKISILCGPLCGIGTWLLNWYHSKSF